MVLPLRCEEAMIPTHEIESRGPGRPSKVAPFLGMLYTWLDHDPTIKTSEVLARLRKRGFKGGHSGVYAVVAGLRKGLAPKP
jgi:hypothetical protein